MNEQERQKFIDSICFANITKEKMLNPDLLTENDKAVIIHAWIYQQLKKENELIAKLLDRLKELGMDIKDKDYVLIDNETKKEIDDIMHKNKITWQESNDTRRQSIT